MAVVVVVVEIPSLTGTSSFLACVSEADGDPQGWGLLEEEEACSGVERAFVGGGGGVHCRVVSEDTRTLIASVTSF